MRRRAHPTRACRRLAAPPRKPSPARPTHRVGARGFALLPAIVIGSAAAYAANGRRLLQIGAEIAGQSGRSIPMSATPREPELVCVMNILPGDWICPADRYKKILEEAKQKDLRKRERAEILRTASGLAERAPDNSNQAGMKDPAIPLEFVIATEGSPDKKNIILKLENRDVLELSRDQSCYRRRLKYKPNRAPGEASLVLTELLTALDRDSTYESDLIGHLAEIFYEIPIHHALRAALSQGFIKQKVGLERAFQEVCAIFSLRMDAGLRRKCLVSLSQAGKIWVQSGIAPEPQMQAKEASEPKSAYGTTNNYFTGPLILHTVISARYFGKSGDRPPHRRKSPEEYPTATGRRAEANHDTSEGLAVAWSGCVSATGAGLAALLLTGEAPWQRALFISLIFISSCTFLILILAGLPSMMSRWRELRSTPPRRDAAADNRPE